MAEAANIVLRRLELLWYYVFLVYGITISTRNKHQSYSRMKTCIFIIFLTTNVIPFGFVLHKIYRHGTSTSELVFNGAGILFHINILASSIVLYKRRVQISDFLDQLMKNLGERINLSELRNRLILDFTLVTLNPVMSLILFTIEVCNNNNNNNNISHTSKNAKPILNFDRDFTKYNNIKGLEILKYVHWCLVKKTYSGFSMIFFVYICQLMSKNFETLKYSIEKSLNSDVPITNKCLNNVYQKYNGLCKLTSKLSILFSPLLLFWSAGGLIIICLAVHMLKYMKETSYFIYGLYLLFSFREIFLLYMLYSKAANIHDEATATAVLISKLHVAKHGSPDHGAKISQILFLIQLQKQTVGVNVSGLYTITNSSMLSMLGTLLTYSIILYQTE
uniref:Gustatory receptor n=1 Tax=Strigamia maritima TaxID=126957 RepID=T1JNZ0_STRMM